MCRGVVLVSKNSCRGQLFCLPVLGSAGFASRNTFQCPTAILRKVAMRCAVYI